MADCVHTTRRRLLKAGTAALAAGATPAVASARAEATPIGRLFDEWRALGPDVPFESDEEADARCWRVIDIEEAMAFEPALSMHDLAKKIYVWLDVRNENLSESALMSAAVFAELRHLAEGAA